jgi:hypothetical protein
LAVLGYGIIKMEMMELQIQALVEVQLICSEPLVQAVMVLLSCNGTAVYHAPNQHSAQQIAQQGAPASIQIYVVVQVLTLLEASIQNAKHALQEPTAMMVLIQHVQTVP